MIASDVPRSRFLGGDGAGGGSDGGGGDGDGGDGGGGGDDAVAAPFSVSQIFIATLVVVPPSPPPPPPSPPLEPQYTILFSISYS
ncbi:hypothetical protein M0804_006201 [Polistes exclamans]|nr:hypothetical protein M0804_006201 [Polistes exclamans]